MVNVTKLGILLNKTTNSFECDGVLNPAVIKIDDTIHLFYRALAIDNYSTIGYCKLSSPMVIVHRDEKPLLFPESEYEFQGLEDPRIVKIEEIYYLSYTAFDGVNALGALATSIDLVNWKKHGIIVPKITYEEFKHFTETKGTIHEKYIRFNDYQKSHQKQDRKIFLWDKNLIFFLQIYNFSPNILYEPNLLKDKYNDLVDEISDKFDTIENGTDNLLQKSKEMLNKL